MGIIERARLNHAQNDIDVGISYDRLTVDAFGGEWHPDGVVAVRAGWHGIAWEGHWPDGEVTLLAQPPD